MRTLIGDSEAIQVVWGNLKFVERGVQQPANMTHFVNCVIGRLPISPTVWHCCHPGPQGRGTRQAFLPWAALLSVSHSATLSPQDHAVQADFRGRLLRCKPGRELVRFSAINSLCPGGSVPLCSGWALW